jgi:hypothetical protein
MTMQLRILDQIYPFMGNVAVSATSEDPEFPASNLTKSFRSKVYRSSGYFEITASKCKIDFKESSGGGVLTATIAADSYTPTELAAAIAAALTAAGSVSYTVSFSSLTGLWTITSPGTYLALLWSSGSNAASSIGPTIGFSSLSDLTGSLSYSGAKIAIHSYEAVVFDLGVKSPVDSACILFDPRTPIKLSASAEIRLQAGPTLAWDTAVVDQVITIDDDYGAITHFFSSTQNQRYWRIKVTDPANANLYVELPKVILSSATQLIQLPDQSFSFSKTDMSKVQRTDYGQEYVDSYPIMRELAITYAGLTYSDAKMLSQVFDRVGNAKPILAVLDPLADQFDQNHFLLYGKLSGASQLTGVSTPFFSSGLMIKEANG